MEMSPMTALSAMSAQGQTQQIMQASMLKAAAAQEGAMVEMMQQATNMVKAHQQAPAPEGMGANVDKMA